MGDDVRKTEIGAKTTIKNIDSGCEEVFESITAAALYLNSSRSSVISAYQKGRTVRAKNNSVWMILKIGG